MKGVQLFCSTLLCWYFQDDFVFIFISELHDDNAMEVIMRSKDMTIWERIDSFYAAPFTKFMGNLVTALIIIILFVFENTVNCRLKAPPLSPSYKPPPVIAPSSKIHFRL